MGQEGKRKAGRKEWNGKEEKRKQMRGRKGTGWNLTYMEEKK